MKTARNKLPAKEALLSSTAVPTVSNIAPDAVEDEDQLVRTSEAAHRLGVSGIPSVSTWRRACSTAC